MSVILFASTPTTFWGWVVFHVVKYWPLFLRGVGVTLLLAIVGTVVGFAIGLIVQVIREIPLVKSDPPVKKVLLNIVKWILSAYIEIFRATPMIVQAMVIYYGLEFAGVHLPTLPAGLLIISINTGAYISEIVRGGITSVDNGQTEGALSIGMTHWQTMIYVVLPQAIRNILPTLGNEFIINIKDSAVLSVISVTDLFFQTKSAAGAYYQTFPAFFIACVLYFVMTFAVSRILRKVENKMDGPKNFSMAETGQEI